MSLGVGLGALLKHQLPRCSRLTFGLRAIASTPFRQADEPIKTTGSDRQKDVLIRWDLENQGRSSDAEMDEKLQKVFSRQKQKHSETESSGSNQQESQNADSRPRGDRPRGFSENRSEGRDEGSRGPRKIGGRNIGMKPSEDVSLNKEFGPKAGKAKKGGSKAKAALAAAKAKEAEDEKTAEQVDVNTLIPERGGVARPWAVVTPLGTPFSVIHSPAQKFRGLPSAFQPPVLKDISPSRGFKAPKFIFNINSRFAVPIKHDYNADDMKVDIKAVDQTHEPLKKMDAWTADLYQRYIGSKATAPTSTQKAREGYHSPTRRSDYKWIPYDFRPSSVEMDAQDIPDPERREFFKRAAIAVDNNVTMTTEDKKTFMTTLKMRFTRPTSEINELIAKMRKHQYAYKEYLTDVEDVAPFISSMGVCLKNRTHLHQTLRM
eukprot:TRINITY_DN19174_c0_g1::TRINITY_DN19174_c0_g1_i1::g.2212::m.2212 TRINITY_DN19174_c0_g1::TRINITY_DN19174_c0_g1_i1::g.2212  ORF type:complete len:442 (+),score=60.54,LAGLIDADG_WhiA/PF14527.1/3.3e+02,LAGLIDADG_WhiA/PF14527.1/0.7 TRINITY_DN19174_c0_g1_i1:30-1328(+)